MYSDLFDQLGGGGGSSRNRASDNAPQEPPALVSIKAGKMTLTPTDRGTYQCEANHSRGEIRLAWKDGSLVWEWYDRRERKVVDSTKITDSLSKSTFERIPLTDNQHKEDRIYVWNKHDEYEMYWMQDADESKEDETIAKINQYLADPKSAAPEGETPAAPSNQAQVDALSSILENLGMPQADGGADASNSGGGGSNTGGTLTLADLQNAMSGIHQQPVSRPGPSLAEIVTPGAITSLLENEHVRNRLMELLPPEQRTPEFLEDNLRSPQVQQTLRSLTLALMPDDAGNMDGFYSVIANFNLDPADGNDALAANNPIQAFLDCLLKKVEKEKEQEGSE